MRCFDDPRNDARLMEGKQSTNGLTTQCSFVLSLACNVMREVFSEWQFYDAKNALNPYFTT